MRKYDPFEHHIGSYDNNVGIWVQYKLLVEKAYENLENDEFNRNLTIIPLLHLMSHALELGLKENIGFLKRVFPDFRSQHEKGIKGGYEMTHNGYKLFRIFNDFVMQRVLNLPNIPLDIKRQTRTMLGNLGEFISDVNPHTTTYRYSHIFIEGGKVELSIPRDKTIKINKVYKNFIQAQDLLLYIQSVYETWFDFIEFKTIKPEYKEGVGFLWEPKAQFNIHSQFNITWSDVISWIEKRNVDGSEYFRRTEGRPTEDELKAISEMDDDDPFKELLLSSATVDDEYLKKQYHIKTIREREVYYDLLRNQYFEFYELNGYHWTPVISEETYKRKYC